MNNVLKEIDEGYRWEAERKRRMRYIRREAFKNALRDHRVCVTLMSALTLGVFAFILTWNGCIAPTLERAAYLEGRYDLDHATALAMAKAESEAR